MEQDRAEISESEPEEELFASAPDDLPPDPYPGDPATERSVFTTPIDPDVQTILDQMNDRELIVKPDFQRGSVWSRPRQSRLIESLLVEIPIPPCYFAEDKDGTRVVVDGQQRLRAIEEYRAGLYALTGLEIRSDLNQKRWTDLDPRDARRIVRRVLRTIVISHFSDPDIKFEIFRRLNTGGVPLTEQEIRNAVYRGPFNELLDRLVHNGDFLGLLRREAPDNRLRHHELVLRFFALDSALPNFRPPLKRVLNGYMESAREFQSKRLSEVETRFDQAITAVATVFGADAFRRYTIQNGDHAIASYESVVSRAVYDLQMVGLVDVPTGDLQERQQDIKREFQSLSLDSDFGDLLSRATDHRSRFYRRLRLWGERLAGIGVQAPFYDRLPEPEA